MLLDEPNSSVGSLPDLRTASGWFDPWLCQYSFRGFMVVIATGFIYETKTVQGCFDTENTKNIQFQ